MPSLGHRLTHSYNKIWSVQPLLWVAICQTQNEKFCLKGKGIKVEGQLEISITQATRKITPGKITLTLWWKLTAKVKLCQLIVTWQFSILRKDPGTEMKKSVLCLTKIKNQEAMEHTRKITSNLQCLRKSPMHMGSHELTWLCIIKTLSQSFGI